MAGFRVHVAASLDGFIADREGGIGWLAPYRGFEDGQPAFLDGVKALVMGRTTYEHLRIAAGGGWPYGERRTVVVTSHSLDTAPDAVEPWLGDLGMLVDELRAAPGGDVWVVGGAKAIRAFLDLGAIDYLDLYLVPLLLGDGKRLFLPSENETRLTLLASRALPDGIVRLTYRVG